MDELAEPGMQHVFTPKLCEIGDQELKIVVIMMVCRHCGCLANVVGPHQGQ